MFKSKIKQNKNIFFSTLKHNIFTKYIFFLNGWDGKFCRRYILKIFFLWSMALNYYEKYCTQLRKTIIVFIVT